MWRLGNVLYVRPRSPRFPSRVRDQGGTRGDPTDAGGRFMRRIPGGMAAANVGVEREVSMRTNRASMFGGVLTLAVGLLLSTSASAKVDATTRQGATPERVQPLLLADVVVQGQQQPTPAPAPAAPAPVVVEPQQA